MTIAFSDLITAVTVDEAKTSIYGVLEILGVPTTGWISGAVVRTIAHGCAVVISGCTEVTSLIAKGGFRGHAVGNWLTLLSKQMYNVDRGEATFATGKIQLTSSGSNIYTGIPIDDLTFENPTTKKTYRNKEVVNLAPGEVASSSPPVVQGPPFRCERSVGECRETGDFSPTSAAPRWEICNGQGQHPPPCNSGGRGRRREPDGRQTTRMGLFFPHADQSTPGLLFPVLLSGTGVVLWGEAVGYGLPRPCREAMRFSHAVSCSSRGMVRCSLWTGAAGRDRTWTRAPSMAMRSLRQRPFRATR